MQNVKQSRLMIIDSELNSVSERGKCRILIPNHPFSVQGESKMRITLLSFVMRRQWYNINQTNNEFYLYTPSFDLFVPVTIQPGVYTKFDGGIYNAAGAGSDTEPKGLGHAISDALQESVIELNAALSSGVTVSTALFNANTRGFSFTFGGTGLAALNLQIVSFQCKNGTLPVGVSNAGFFSDVHEIIGCIPTRDANNIQNGLAKSGNTFTSIFAASLNSLEAIYLRCNVQTSNYQTHGFERSMPDRNGMSETNIFARIPLSRSCFDPVFEFIQFEDSNDLFQMHLRQKTLDSLILEVTDDKGRLLSETDPRQSHLGLMSFKCVLRWDEIGSHQIQPHLKTGHRDPPKM